MIKKQALKRIGGLMPMPLVRKLEAARKRNDRSLAAEMRIRLEQSFSVEGEGGKAEAASGSAGR